MEGKAFSFQSLIWAIILLGQIHVYKSCIAKERKALLELTGYKEIIGTKRDCCHWEGVTCSRTTGRVIMLSFSELWFKDTSLLDLSLLHPFEDLQSLDLSRMAFNGWFDDVEGYKSLSRLRNLEILDLSYNIFNNSIIPFLNAATSLTTLFLRGNNMSGPFPVKELKVWKNLEVLDLSENRFNGFIPIRELSAFKKLKVLDLSGNAFSGSVELQGVFIVGGSATAARFRREEERSRGFRREEQRIPARGGGGDSIEKKRVGERRSDSGERRSDSGERRDWAKEEKKFWGEIGMGRVDELKEKGFLF